MSSFAFTALCLRDSIPILFHTSSYLQYEYNPNFVGLGTYYAGVVARVDYANTYTGTTAYHIAYDDGELESDVVLENIRVIEKHANTTNPPGLGVEVVEKDATDTLRY